LVKLDLKEVILEMKTIMEWTCDSGSGVESLLLIQTCSTCI